MSGSPIIQNGKLVGAVTHVLVNKPTRGYGIFIDNMLEAEKVTKVLIIFYKLIFYTKKVRKYPNFYLFCSFLSFLYQG